MSKKKKKKSVKFGWEYGKGYNTTYAGRKISPRHRVEIMGVSDPTEVLGNLPAYGYESDWESLKTQYGYTSERSIEGEVVVTVRVPADQAPVVSVDPGGTKTTPLMCVYTAVDDFCTKLLGVKMDDADRQFFINHPLVDVDGVPFQHTLRVVQELIDPYGLRVSRVQLAPGQAVKGDILQWRKVLGINPAALTDKLTTNADFGAEPGQFLFEYNDIPMSPSISCGVAGQIQGVTGSTGGHAQYVSPRSAKSGALLSFQLDRAANVTWKKQPIFEPLPEAVTKGVECFGLDTWFSKYKLPYNELEKIRTEREKALKKDTKFNTPKTYLGSGTKKPECYNCNRKDQTFVARVPGVCDGCWDQFLQHSQCSKCNGKTGNYYPAFIYRYLESSQIIVQCNQGCRSEYFFETMKGNGRRYHKRIFDAISKAEVDKLIDNYQTEEDKLKAAPPATPDPNDIPNTEPQTGNENTEAGKTVI